MRKGELPSNQVNTLFFLMLHNVVKKYFPTSTFSQISFFSYLSLTSDCDCQKSLILDSFHFVNFDDPQDF